MTVQAKTLILLNFFIADSPAKHQQSGKLGFYQRIRTNRRLSVITKEKLLQSMRPIIDLESLAICKE